MAMHRRKPDYPIDPLFLKRYSAYAMSSEPLAVEELMSLFEAARWAPSSYNNQPWRFIYALRGGSYWESFFNLIVPENQRWAAGAGALIVIASHKVFDLTGSPSRTHSFDTGAAWEDLALQATCMGLATHAIEGFDYYRAAQELCIPGDYQVEAMVAIGKPGNPEALPETLREREEHHTGRKPLSELVFEGIFKQ